VERAGKAVGFSGAQNDDKGLVDALPNREGVAVRRKGEIDFEKLKVGHMSEKKAE
jgi:hypothetical protein